MNSVQFGARNPRLADLAKQIAAEQAKQLTAEAKAALDVVKNVDSSQLVALTEAVVTAQLGDKAEFVKTIALGSEQAAGEAMMNTFTEGVERAGNVVTAIAENFGDNAGAVASGLAQQGLGLVNTGLGLLRQGAQLAPVVLPAVADQAQKSFEKNAQGQEKAAGILEQAAAKVNANAAEVKVFGGKVSEFLTALGTRIGAAQAPEQGE
jgi:hypothetical protein